MKIRYHAAARELAGCAEEDVVLDANLDGDALRELIAARHARLGPYLTRMRFARNGELGAATRFEPTDVVDVLPPVAGGSGAIDRVTLVDIRRTPLSIDECVDAVRHPSAGGISVFCGVVRDHADGLAVRLLEYEAHAELALPEARRVVLQVAEELADVRLAVVHRVGALEVGETAVIVAASAPHRDEAFVACRRCIDRFKETVPIWKKEHPPEGAARWVNLEPRDD